MRSNNVANTGKITQVATLSSALCAPETQLLRVQYDEPRQLACTLVQVARAGNPVTPWLSEAIDGQTFPGGFANSFNAPYEPITAGTWQMRCRLRWGVGGAATVAIFDYPNAGQTFGVVGQEVSLDVLWYDTLNRVYRGPEFAQADRLPVIGAFIAPGQVGSEPFPLRLRELPVALNPVSNLTWGVKSHARRVRVTTTTENVTTLWVRFLRRDGSALSAALLSSTATSLIDATIDIPPTAVALWVQNRSASVQISVGCEWQIGFV